MATPVQRTSHVPVHPAADLPSAEPVPVVAPFGWLLALIGGIGLLLATWLIYPTDYDGMWAGYRGSLIGTVVILAAMSLRTSLPARPAIALIGLCGVLLVLFAVFLDNSHRVLVSELAAGIVMLLGAGLQAAGPQRK
jgi:drug/metabolite transporter (DMT)-like permease